MTPDAVIREWFEQVWTGRREDAVDRLMAPNGVFHDLPTPGGGPMQSPDDFRPFHRKFLAAFTDIRVEVLHTIVDGEFVAARCRVTLTHGGDGLGIAPTGRTVTFPGMVFAKVQNDRLVEGWNCFDFLSLYQQLGIIPALA